MSPFLVIVRQEILAVRRERLPALMLGIFIALIAISSLIGFLTKTTVSDVWVSVSEAGLTSVANPFASISPLYYARNTVIYIILIGTLMAIIAGVTSGIRDRKAATVDLILTRPSNLKTIIFGKLTGLAIWLTAVISIAAAIATMMITLIAGNPLPINEYLRLLAFFALSVPLLLGFAAIGVLSGLISQRESTSLLAPIAIWALLTFVAPQLGTAARPVALLNPVPVPPTTSGAFDLLNLVTSPFAISEKFKVASGILLKDPDISGSIGQAVLSIGVFLLVTVALLLVVDRSRIRGIDNE